MVRRIAFVACVLLSGCKDEVGQGSSALVLGAPANLTAASQNGGMEIALAWTDTTPDETGFRIEVNDAPFGSPPYLDAVFLPANVTAYVYPSEPNQTRYFRVFAITAGSQSESSNIASVTTPNVPYPPAYFTVLGTGPVTIDMRWINPGPPLSHTMERSEDGGVSWVTLFTLTLPTGLAQFQDYGGLLPNRSYLYRLWATNANGAGGMSFSSTATQTTPASMVSLATPGDDGWRTSLAVSPSGIAHVSHYDNSMGQLLLTRGTYGGGYSTVVLDGGGPAGAVGYHGISLTLDGGGKVHILAHEVHSDSLRHVTNVSGVFGATTIDANRGKRPQIRWSSAAGLLYAVYRPSDSGPPSGLLWTTSVPGSAWGTPVDTYLESMSSSGHSFAVDSQGEPQIVVMSLSGTLYHAYSGDGNWHFTPIAGEQTEHTSVDIDSSNVLHVAYHDSAAGRLRYATDSGGTWKRETLHAHTTGNLGTFNSIAVNPATGAVHVAYYNSVEGDLWYARRSPTGTWTRQLLDSAGDVGRHASIALDPSSAQDRVYIAYYDATNGDLKIVSHLP